MATEAKVTEKKTNEEQLKRKKGSRGLTAAVVPFRLFSTSSTQPVLPEGSWQKADPGPETKEEPNE